MATTSINKDQSNKSADDIALMSARDTDDEQGEEEGVINEMNESSESNEEGTSVIADSSEDSGNPTLPKDGKSQKDNKEEDYKPLLPIIEEKNWELADQWFENIQNKASAKKGLLEEQEILHKVCEYKAPLAVFQKILEIGGAEIAKIKGLYGETGLGYGKLPLHLACSYNNNLEVIQALIDAYPGGARTQDYDGNLPLHKAWACGEKNDWKVIQALINAYPKGARIQNKYGNLPLHNTCYSKNDLEVIQTLLDAYPEGVETRSSCGMLPLHWACWKKKNDLEVIQALMNAYPKGSRIQDNDGKLPLHYSCGQKNDLKVIQALMNAYHEGARVQDKYGKLPLHYACGQKNDLKVIQALMNAYPEGVEIRSRVSGKLPLHFACFSKIDLEVTQALIDAYPEGARIQDNDGKLPLHWACKEKNDLEVIQALINAYPKGSRIQDSVGRLPLHYACEEKNNLKVILELMFAYPEGARVQDKRGKLPLSLDFWKRNDLEVTQALVDAYPEVARIQDEWGTLPLLYACEKNLEPRLIRTLIDKYPEAMGMGDDDGLTPFETSKEYDAGKHFQFVLQNDCYWEDEGSKDQAVLGERKLESCRKYMPPGVFVNAAMDNLDSRRFLEWLNKLSCNRKVVFSIMLNLYIHIAIVVSFSSATNQYLLESDPVKGWAISLIPLAVLMLLLELLQIWNYRKQKRSLSYFVDVWNWIEVTAMVLIIVMASRLIVEESIEFDSDRETTRELLMSTGFFILFAFISFLKKTFFPFSMFVGGLIHIFWVLIPFAVITGVLLAAFAYLYFVQSNVSQWEDCGKCRGLETMTEDCDGCDGHETLLASFLTTFASFVGGPDDTPTLLDVIYGVVTVIILLNVVIAIISKAWDDATEIKNARRVFWKYRINLFYEVDMDPNVFFSRLEKSELLSISKSEVYPSIWGFAQFAFCFLCAALGFISFGVLFPKFMLEYAFAENLGDEDNQKDAEKVEVNELLSKVDDLKSENKDLATKINSMQAEVAKIDELKTEMAQILALLQGSFPRNG